jgi:hypothetical protein
LNGFAGFAVDGVVISDDELVEEGLVGDPRSESSMLM